MKSREFDEIGNLPRRVLQFLHLYRARRVVVCERGPERVQFVAGQWRHEEVAVHQKSVIALPLLRFNTAEDKFGRRCSSPDSLRCAALRYPEIEPA